jgi:hypothetical protein
MSVLTVSSVCECSLEKEYSPAKTQEATGIVVRVRQDSAVPAARQCWTNRLCSMRAINTIRKKLYLVIQNRPLTRWTTRRGRSALRMIKSVQLSGLR